MSRTLSLQLMTCYSPLEQYITRFDLSFELMLNELCSLSNTEWFSLIKVRGHHEAPKYTQKYVE